MVLKNDKRLTIMLSYFSIKSEIHLQGDRLCH
jgi:hypothetical protein